MSEAGNGYGSGLERGARRKKLAGYLKAANELRQSYQAQYLGSGTDGPASEDEGSIPGAFPDVSVVRNGDEEMLLFPSYARRHHKRPGVASDKPGTNEDIRDAQGPGDAEYWKKQWDKYEDENAVIDVDIRGWVYAPHKGQMTRKNRLLVGIARHLSGVPAPSSSRPSSRAASPYRTNQEICATKNEEELVEKEADSIERRGQGEADVAWRGGFSETPSNATETSSLYSSPVQSRSASPDGKELANRPLARPVTAASLGDLPSSRARNKQSSWSQPSEMSPEELYVANANLMLRLKPFLTTPLVQTPLTVFFYNDEQSKSRTIYTNEAGHFQIRAPLDFTPTHVRVLASDKLSATEEVRITEPKGISMISDIDDTIKHSAIGGGAKEIFRNAFIRDLGDLTIEGVKEWYEQMASMGVKLHYVSNAPWQLYPVLKTFFAQAGLPQGSFHLKQYSGMLQGIFEPVAERKKGTLEKIMNDFPHRRFLLVGDSGEADLELYTDIVLANPGRILGVFIRDVTTTQPQRFFDSTTLSRKPQKSPLLRGRSGGLSPKLRPLESTQSEGPPPPLPPRASSSRSLSSQASRTNSSGPKMGTLIDVDDNPTPSPQLHRTPTDTEKPFPTRTGSVATTRSPPPTLPSKPLALRTITSGQVPVMTPINSGQVPTKASIDGASLSSPPSKTSISRKPAPPPPPPPRRGLKTSSSISELPQNSNIPVDPSPLSQIQTSSSTSKPPPSEPGSRATSQERYSYRTAAKNKLASAYNALPSWNPTTPPDGSPPTASPQQMPLDGTKMSRPPPPLPPRRGLSSYPAAAAQYASNRLSGGWSGSSADRDGCASEEPGMEEGPLLTKKEELWVRRWARAKEIFDEKNVVLRSWRVGSDVAHEAENLVEAAFRDENGNNSQRGGRE